MVAWLRRVLFRRELGWALFGASIVALFLATPFILREAAPSGMNWQKLSNISQTYGGLAVPFSAAALLGAVVSIAHQAKQTRIMHEEAMRSAHRELILRAIDDQALMQCWDPPNGTATFEDTRQAVFCNLIFTKWLTDFRLGRMTYEASRVTLEVHFRGEVARRHWRENREHWRRFAVADGDRRVVRFMSLTDEVYEEALASGPPVAASAYFSPPNL